MNLSMTHPDILQIERDGFLGKELTVIAVCGICGYEIIEYDDYYNPEGMFICDECDLEYMKRFRKVGA